MRLLKSLSFLLLVAAAFAAGLLVSQREHSHEEHASLVPRPSSKVRYQCPMHPQVIQDTPGICPICHMDLQRVVEGEADAEVPAMPGSGAVPEHAPFALSTARQQLIGVTRGKVERRALTREIRAFGKVAYDPTLYQAITDYREAVRARSAVADSSLPETREGARSLVASAVLRLRQLGLSDAQIRELAAGGAAPTNLLLPGKSVWVYAQVYPYEMELVQVGQSIEVTTPALPGRSYSAKVAAIDPAIDAATRTLRVRALVQTPDAQLRPETYVHVTIRVPLGEKVAVPENAVLHTGMHHIVFVVRGDGYFEPRDVGLGRQAEGYYEVLSGVEPGEEIVTSANFLIDSESRFRAALEAFSAREQAK